MRSIKRFVESQQRFYWQGTCNLYCEVTYIGKAKRKLSSDRHLIIIEENTELSEKEIENSPEFFSNYYCLDGCKGIND